MNGLAAGWLIDTLLYTGLLLGLVLLLRRPVARWFGPQVAYALWLLPLLRLLLPPLVLPASLAPAPPLATVPEPAPGLADVAGAALPAGAAASAWLVLLLLWLLGAMLFLGWRVAGYRAMRRILLADAVPVGTAGRIRLVETPAASSPVAFGILDPVIALPPAFMALHDRQARDLALAHELAHHRGGDLVANVAAQLVLALHWFNPLAWLAWQAMRRDQEAACDARVLAGRDRAERARYAELIAGLALGRPLAIAAPMACPVLGEKAIVQRLRLLGVGEVSLRRRRCGLGAVGLAVLSLPLTASISYAEPVRTRSLAGDLAPGAVAEASLAGAGQRGEGSGQVVRTDAAPAGAAALHPAAAQHAPRAAADEDRLAQALQAMPCTGAQVVIERELADGRRVLVICPGFEPERLRQQARATMAQARAAMARAEAEGLAAKGRWAATRAQVQRELERALEALGEAGLAASPASPPPPAAPPLPPAAPAAPLAPPAPAAPVAPAVPAATARLAFPVAERAAAAVVEVAVNQADGVGLSYRIVEWRLVARPAPAASPPELAPSGGVI